MNKDFPLCRVADGMHGKTVSKKGLSKMSKNGSKKNQVGDGDECGTKQSTPEAPYSVLEGNGTIKAVTSSQVDAMLNDAINGGRRVTVVTPDGNLPEWLADKGKADTLADIEMWKAIVSAKGRDAIVNSLIRGDTCTWLGSDSAHKLYIKASNGAEVRNLLRTYTDSELAEWFSLMTSSALAQTTLMCGMRWKQLSKNEPVMLTHCPSLQELRELFELA
jgi:hypothetical protein